MSQVGAAGAMHHLYVNPFGCGSGCSQPAGHPPTPLEYSGPWSENGRTSTEQMKFLWASICFILSVQLFWFQFFRSHSHFGTWPVSVVLADVPARTFGHFRRSTGDWTRHSGRKGNAKLNMNSRLFVFRTGHENAIFRRSIKNLSIHELCVTKLRGKRLSLNRAMCRCFAGASRPIHRPDIIHLL